MDKERYSRHPVREDPVYFGDFLTLFGICCINPQYVAPLFSTPFIAIVLPHDPLYERTTPGIAQSVQRLDYTLDDREIIAQFSTGQDISLKTI